MNQPSPFSLNRFELSGYQIYYIPLQTYKILQEPKSTCVIGTRGTGKTTLLHALNWKERLENKSLHQQIGDDVFGDHTIGLYLKLPEYGFLGITDWLEGKPDAMKESIVSVYFESLWIPLFFDALSGMCERGLFDITTEEEEILCQKLISIIPELDSQESDPICSLPSLARSFIRFRKKIEGGFRFGSSPEALLDKIPAIGIGGLAIAVGKSIRDSISLFSSTGYWKVKICLDEAECLSEYFQRFLNTLIRNASHPFFYAVSYVRFPDHFNSTLIPNLSVNSADRLVIALDDMTDAAFNDFVEGVMSVRIRALYPNKKQDFSTQRLLGSLDINGMLHNILKKSESPFAKDIMAEAIAYGDELAKLGEHDSLIKSPPIYQWYIVKKLGLNRSAPNEPKWKKRSQESAEIRKKISGSYLSLCHELKTDPVYASADMVLQISDKCVRDFLMQINQIHIESKKDIESFLSSQINPEVQDRAIKYTARMKWAGVRASGIRMPMKANFLIETLSEVTAILQRESSNFKHLKSTERGLFYLKKSEENQKAFNKITDIVKDASEAGYFKVTGDEDGSIKFRVHCSLAPHFKFSYRGAYYPILVQVEDLEKIIDLADSDQRNKEALLLARKLSKSNDDDGQQQIPGIGDQDA